MRKASSDKSELKKGTWTAEEDRKLTAYVTRYGCWNWRQLPRFAGLARCGKSCRLRWLNYLRPGIKRGNYTPEEDEIIIRLHRQLGNRWSAIAVKLPGRTDNEIKNHWHTNLKNKHFSELHQNKSDVDTHDTDDIDIIFKLSNNNDNDHCEGINIADAGMSSQTIDVGKSSPETETSSSESASDITRESNEEFVMEEHKDFGFVDAYEEVMGGSFWTEPFVADDSFFSHVTHDGPRHFTPSPLSDNIAEFWTLNNFYDHYSGFF